MIAIAALVDENRALAFKGDNLGRRATSIIWRKHQFGVDRLNPHKRLFALYEGCLIT